MLMSNINTPSSHQAPLILVVDDDRTMRSLLNLALEEEGYQVAQAKNGEQGLAEYTRLQPDMVLLDAVMPDMDGFACCERIRQLNHGDLVPILMITVLDDRESIEQAFAVGATDYITKPLHWEVLSHRVKRLLKAYQGILEIEKVKEQLRNQKTRSQTLRDTLHKLWQCSDVWDTLPSLLTDIQHLLKVEQIVLFQQENKHLIESVSPGYLSVEAMTILMDNLILETESTFQNRQERIIAIDALNQIELSPAIVTQLAESKTNALLIAPIIIQKQFWGLLCAHHYHNFYKWKKLEFEQFSDIAKLLSIVICNLSRE